MKCIETADFALDNNGTFQQLFDQIERIMDEVKARTESLGLYPLAIVLVALSLLDRFWLSSSRVFVPVMAVTLVFGVVDGLAAAGLGSWVPALFTQLPLADQSMGWLVPVLVMLVLAVVTDRLLGRAERVQHRA